MGSIRAAQAIAQEKLVFRTVPAGAVTFRTPAMNGTPTNPIVAIVSAHKLNQPFSLNRKHLYSNPTTCDKHSTALPGAGYLRRAIDSLAQQLADADNQSGANNYLSTNRHVQLQKNIYISRS